MKIWSFVLAVALSLSADTTLFSLGVVTQSDTNQTQVLEDDKYLDENIIAYKQVVQTLKNNPLHFKSLQKSYTDKTQLFKDKTLLANRVEVNKNRGNDLAVMRDSIALDTLEVEAMKHQFLASVAEELLSFEDKKIPSIIDESLLKLKMIDLKTYKLKASEIKEQQSSVANDLKSNYLAFEKAYKFYENLLRYMRENVHLFKVQKTFFNLLALDKIIDMINENNFFQEYNEQLRFFHIDSGRLVLFATIIFFFLLLKDIGRAFVFFIIRKFLSYYKEGEFSELMIAHVHKIKRVVNYLISLLGIDMAIKVLYYPNEVSPFWDTTLYILYMILFVILLFRVAEIALEIFVQVRSREKTKMRNELVNLFINITKALILIVAALLLLRHLGVDITGLVASLGVGGLAIALASKDTLSNFFASVKIILEDAFHQGDWIETAEFEGVAVELGFTSTKIRTFDNALISVPNEKLANVYIKNWSKRIVGRRIKFHLSLSYNSKKENLQNAVLAIREMLRDHPDIVTDKKMTQYKSQKRLHRSGLFSADDKYGVKTTLLVYLDELSPSTMDVLVYAFTTTVNWEEWLSVKEDVFYKIWTILEENDLEFAYPTQVVYHQALDKNEVKKKLI